MVTVPRDFAPALKQRLNLAQDCGFILPIIGHRESGRWSALQACCPDQTIYLEAENASAWSLLNKLTANHDLTMGDDYGHRVGEYLRSADIRVVAIKNLDKLQKPKGKPDTSLDTLLNICHASLQFSKDQRICVAFTSELRWRERISCQAIPQSRLLVDFLINEITPAEVKAVFFLAAKREHLNIDQCDDQTFAQWAKRLTPNFGQLKTLAENAARIASKRKGKERCLTAPLVETILCHFSESVRRPDSSFILHTTPVVNTATYLSDLPPRGAVA